MRFKSPTNGVLETYMVIYIPIITLSAKYINHDHMTQFTSRPVQISHFSLGHLRHFHDPVFYPDDPAIRSAFTGCIIDRCYEPLNAPAKVF